MFLFDSDDFDRQMNMEKMVWGRLRRLSLTSVRTAKYRIFLIDSVCFDCLPFFSPTTLPGHVFQVEAG